LYFAFEDLFAALLALPRITAFVHEVGGNLGALVEDDIGKMSLRSLDTGQLRPLRPAPKGQPIALWPHVQLHHLPTATSRSLGIAVVTKQLSISEDVELLDLMSGKTIGHLPSKGTGDAEFGPNEILLVAETDRVSLWNAPDAQKLGDLYIHPEREAAALLTPSGEFETSSDVSEWQQVLRCQVGPVELPLHVCVDAYFTPGIGRTLLSSAADGARSRSNP